MPNEYRLPRPGAAQALAWLEQRVFAAAQLGEETWDSLFASSSPTVVIGAGGSFPAADFIARLLRDHGTPARASYPLDASGPEQRMVAVSYSGSTPDIHQAILRARHTTPCEVVLLTGSHSPSLPVDQVLCHRPQHRSSSPSTEPERGFLSYASTLGPIAAALGTHLGATATCASYYEAQITGSRDSLETTSPLEVIATGYGWPTALDLEAKWTEADLGPLRSHEQKNLSHGRFQSLFHPPSDSQPTAVLISTGQSSSYTKYLRELLRSHLALLELHSPLLGPLGGFATLVASQSLCVDLGASRGIDVSRPSTISPEGLTLYNWDWDS